MHATQINPWKKQLLESAEGISENGNGKKAKPVDTDEPQTAELYEQIGRLKVQLEWLPKKVADDMEVEFRRATMSPSGDHFSTSNNSWDASVRRLLFVEFVS